MLPILVRLSLATLSAVVGGIVAAVLGRRTADRMLPIVFVALGTLLAVTLFDVFPDAKANLTWPVFLLATGSGYGLFWLVSRYLYSICPACAFNTISGDSCEIGQNGEPSLVRAQSLAWLLTIALAVHCTVDGLAIVVGDDLSRGFDPAILLAILVHKLPEGMALGLFLISAGRRPAAAALWTALVESTTLFGGLLGAHWISPQSLFWLSLIFAHVGGGFVYLVVTTLGGLAHTCEHNRRPVLLGGSLAFTITSVLLLSLR